MKGFRGELLGFTYNNVHSSSLGITRTSNGLYDKPLTTGTKDITITIPGRDGQLYYGSIYNQRTINVSYAFEGVSENQINALKRMWNDKGIHDLIFDEEPHKVYSAKASGSAIISHICFERDGQRYYNGEGSLQFICYFPYARSRFSYLEDYIIENIPEWIDETNEDLVLTLEGIQMDKMIPIAKLVYNIYNEEQLASIQKGEEEPLAHIIKEQAQYVTDFWVAASGIPSKQYFGTFEFINDNQCKCDLKNPGDEKALLGIWLRLDIINDDSRELKGQFSLNINKGNETFQLQNIKTQGEDKWVYIDFTNYTIQGYTEYQGERILTDNLYNMYSIGNFFEIDPKTETTLTFTLTNKSGPEFNLRDLNPQIDITYLYL